jgi:hypothetical protein
MNTKARWPKLAAIAALTLLFVGACAPGNARWSMETGNPANFWAGLWHGLIIIVTFIVSLFTSDVKIYEVNNVGWGYNLGFLLGAMISLGGGARSATHRKRREPNWDHVGEKIAREVRSHVRDELKQASGSGQQSSDAEWDEFSRRVEDRIRSEFKKKWND